MTGNTTGRRTRVLVGVDGSAPGRAALEFAVGEARLRGAELVAVMAVQLPDYAWIDPYGVRIPEEDTLQRAREKLDRMLASVNTEDLLLDPVVTAAPAPQALVDSSADCDLLVVGSRGHGGSAAWCWAR
jgi:nucleotide-binding universal stress UspA family protein